MKKAIIILMLASTVTFASAQPIKNKERRELRKEIRREVRFVNKKFDYRNREQKTHDLKMLTVIAVLSIIILKGIQE